MKTCYLIFFLFFTSFVGVVDCSGQRITYSNAQRDSVQIDFGLLDIYHRNYKIHDVQLHSKGTQYKIRNLSSKGNVNIIIPEKFLNNEYDAVLKIIHKTDRTQNVDFSLKGKTVCVGICDIVVIKLNQPMLNIHKSVNEKTILADEIEKGAH